MSKKFPKLVRDQAVRMTLDRLKDFSPMSAACRDLAPKLSVGVGPVTDAGGRPRSPADVWGPTRVRRLRHFTAALRMEDPHRCDKNAH